MCTTLKDIAFMYYFVKTKVCYGAGFAFESRLKNSFHSQNLRMIILVGIYTSNPMDKLVACFILTSKSEVRVALTSNIFHWHLQTGLVNFTFFLKGNVDVLPSS